MICQKQLIKYDMNVCFFAIWLARIVCGCAWSFVRGRLCVVVRAWSFVVVRGRAPSRRTHDPVS